MYQNNKVSVVIPALNEAEAIGHVVADLRALQDDHGQAIIDEIIVCDNGSTDNTAHVAQIAGAVVVDQRQPGYGIACLTALATIETTDIVLFTDGDHSFYAPQAVSLISAVAADAHLSIGARNLGRIEPGALTVPQRFGNQLASWLIRRIWRQQVTDLGPYRAIRYAALQQLNMVDPTFGWTIEMQIKAIQHQFKTVEVPVDTRRRIGRSKISGTVIGTIKAGYGILSMIAKLRWREL